VVLTALIVAITGALAAAGELLKSLRKEDYAALSQATGYGTEAYQPEKTDWPPGTKPKGTDNSGSTNSNTGLIIGAAALAAGLLLLQDDDKKK
jgi:hypothetical protein